MFAVISIENKKKGLFRKKCTVEAIQTPVKGGAPFRIITVSPDKKGINWHGVATQASCASRNLLLPKGIQLPDSPHLSLFKADTLPLLIMLNTAAQKLKNSPEAAKRSLLIEDRSAVLPNYIDRIADCASKIKIITDSPEKYHEASVRLMERFGASLIICSQFAKSEKFDAAVCVKPIKNAVQNFSVATLIEDGTPDIPEQYARLCPSGIDRFDFLCALFECSGVRAIGEYTLNDLI